MIRLVEMCEDVICAPARTRTRERGLQKSGTLEVKLSRRRQRRRQRVGENGVGPQVIPGASSPDLNHVTISDSRAPSENTQQRLSRPHSAGASIPAHDCGASMD